MNKKLHCFVRLMVPAGYLLSIVFATLLWHVPVYAFAGGTGTSSDPFQITTASELASLSSYLGSSHSGKYFKLMNDVDLNVSPYNSGSGWTPIGTQSSSFYGKFDGNFKSISNLYINRSASNQQGLFGHASSGSLIKNLFLRDANVTGNLDVGAVVGYLSGTIRRVGVEGGNVTGWQRTGGLVGEGGTISYSYTNTTVTHSPASSVTCCVGGLTGDGGTSVSNSYSRSPVYINAYSTSNQGAIGGLMGGDYFSGAKTNIYSTGSITIASGSMPPNVGGLTGANYTTNYTSSYWDTEASGLGTSGGGVNVVGKTTLQMKTQATFTNWDFSNVWAIDGSGTINDGYPYLLWQTSLSEQDVPDLPSTLGPASQINGSTITNAQPTFTFTLADANTSDTLKYQIQIDDSSDFGSPVVDYTSALAAQGGRSFTVGQVAGSGTYVAGSSGQSLTQGSYYWRVKNIDSSTLSSAYSVANSGAVAFKVDTTAPSEPGTPTLTTPGNDTTPTWTWTAATDNMALATNAYSVQWSQSSSFASGNSTSTSTTNSFTHVSALSSGVWYFRVRAVDAGGNVSAYTSAASVTIDTTAPTAPGTPSTTANSGSPSQTWTWTASTDAGGLAATPYTIQWSQSSGFASGINSATSSTNSYTVSSLSEGTWYYRIQATDLAGNSSAYSATASFAVDATAPTAPGMPSTASPTNNPTPTLTWAASSDAGVGLANPAYTVEWSLNSGFSSGVTSVTASTASYTPSAMADGTWYFRVKAADSAGNNSSYSSAATVIIDSTAPFRIDSVPSPGAAAVKIGDSLKLTFNEAIFQSSGNIKIYSSNGALIETVNITASQASISGNNLTITPSNLHYGTSYFVLIDSGAVKDLTGNNYAGITDSSAWSFTTENAATGAASSGANRSSRAVITNSDNTNIIANLPKILLNSFPEYSTGAGKQLGLVLKQVVNFMVGPEEHTATVSVVSKEFADIVLASTPQTVRLYIGETKQYDVTRDGKNDIELYLRGIDGEVVDVIFRQLSGTHTISLSQDEVAANAAKLSPSAVRKFIGLAFIGIAAVAALYLIRRRYGRASRATIE